MADLLHGITIEAKAKEVHAAVATQKGMRVEALEAGKRVVLSCSGDPAEWAGTTLEWTLRPDDGGTRLDFRHGDWKAMTPYAIMCNSTWGELMYRLKKFVESGRPNPHWKK